MLDVAALSKQQRDARAESTTPPGRPVAVDLGDIAFTLDDLEAAGGTDKVPNSVPLDGRGGFTLPQRPTVLPVGEKADPFGVNTSQRGRTQSNDVAWP